jgi:hypothetical protein
MDVIEDTLAHGPYVTCFQDITARTRHP